MSLSRRRSFARVTALLALCLFAGYLIADQSCGLPNRQCSEMTPRGCDEDHETCDHCWCAFHSGTVVAFDPVVWLQPVVLEKAGVWTRDERAPGGVPLDIDHPPQLA